MKKLFFDQLDKMMKKNKDIYIIFVGLGWPRVDEFLQKYPDRAINSEASEQTASDIAVGLAYAGKIPVMYTITPFYWRCAETLRTYIDYENLNVKLVGVGQDGDYSDHGDGFSHDARDIEKLFRVLNNFEVFKPKDEVELEQNLNLMIGLKRPSFLNIKR